MKAEICEGEYCLAVGLDPGVAVRRLGDLVGDELLVLLDHRVVVAAPDQALDREDGLFRIGDRLALGRLADEALAVVGEGDDRRRGAHAFGVLDDFRRLAFHDGDARIGGAEVDADDLAHVYSSHLRQAGRALLAPDRDVGGSSADPLDPAPWTRFRRIRGFLAHIGGALGAARQPVTNSRAALKDLPGSHGPIAERVGLALRSANGPAGGADMAWRT